MSYYNKLNYYQRNQQDQRRSQSSTPSSIQAPVWTQMDFPPIEGANSGGQRTLHRNSGTLSIGEGSQNQVVFTNGNIHGNLNGNNAIGNINRLAFGHFQGLSSHANSSARMNNQYVQNHHNYNKWNLERSLSISNGNYSTMRPTSASGMENRDPVALNSMFGPQPVGFPLAQGQYLRNPVNMEQDRIISGCGVVTMLSPKGGLFTPENETGIEVPFQAKDLDGNISDLTHLLRLGTVIMFEGKVNSHEGAIATHVIPLHGKEAQTRFESGIEVDFDQFPRNFDQHKDSYNKDLELAAMEAILGTFVRGRVVSMSLLSLNASMNISTNDPLYNYIGSSTMKRRLFYEKRDHLFALQSDDMITLKHPFIYQMVFYLAKYLVRQGGLMFTDDLYKIYCANDFPIKQWSKTGDSRADFLELLLNKTFVFSVFPSRNYVAVRRNLPAYDYNNFLKRYGMPLWQLPWAEMPPMGNQVQLQNGAFGHWNSPHKNSFHQQQFRWNHHQQQRQYNTYQCQVQQQNIQYGQYHGGRQLSNQSLNGSTLSINQSFAGFNAQNRSWSAFSGTSTSAPSPKSVTSVGVQVHPEELSGKKCKCECNCGSKWPSEIQKQIGNGVVFNGNTTNVFGAIGDKRGPSIALPIPIDNKPIGSTLGHTKYNPLGMELLSTTLHNFEFFDQ